MCFSIQLRATSLRLALIAAVMLALRLEDALARLGDAIDDLAELARAAG